MENQGSDNILKVAAAHIKKRLPFRLPKFLKTAKLHITKRQLLKASLAALFVVLMQFLYPSNRALPFSRLDGTSTSFKSAGQISALLKERISTVQISVKADKKGYQVKPADIGINIDEERTLRSSLSYKWYLKLIPGSSLFIGLNRNTSYETSFDDERMSNFTAQLIEENISEAQNALIRTEGENVVIDKSKPGVIYSKDSVIAQLKSASVREGESVNLKSESTEAKRTEKQLEQLAAEAQRIIDTGINLNLNNEKVSPSKAEIASWFLFTDDPETASISINFKADAIKNYLNQINGKVYISPGTTTVTFVDGVETNRIIGGQGRSIDFGVTTDLILSELRSAEAGEIAVPLVPVPPKVVSNSKYSQTEAGLQALVSDLVSEQEGSWQIMVQDLGGRGWTARVDANRKTTPASTYKLFVAWLALQKIDDGSWQWTDAVYGSQNVDACLEDMIVNSDNECATSFGAKLGGWASVHNAVRAAGYSNTNFVPEFKSTVQDQTTLLQKLYYGQILTGSSRSKLLELMKRQKYREGIPAGTEAVVADKVGFLYGYLHDSAIVYSPSGDYTLVIYTDGSSWSTIASVTRRIHDFLNI